MGLEIAINDLGARGFALTVSCDDEGQITRLQMRGLEGNGYTWQGLAESAVRLAGGSAADLAHSPEAESAMLISTDRALLEAGASKLRSALDDETVLEQLLANADPKLLE